MNHTRKYSDLKLAKLKLLQREQLFQRRVSGLLLLDPRWGL